jgi:acetoacetate decarboxylase
LFLSSDIGVAHGRELHGQPKKLGNPKLEFRGDLIVGTLERNGIDVLTGTMPYKQVPAADISNFPHLSPLPPTSTSRRSTTSTARPRSAS